MEKGDSGIGQYFSRETSRHRQNLKKCKNAKPKARSRNTSKGRNNGSFCDMNDFNGGGPKINNEMCSMVPGRGVNSKRVLNANHFSLNDKNEFIRLLQQN